MPPAIICPSCNASYAYKPEFEGKKLNCARCKTKFAVSTAAPGGDAPAQVRASSPAAAQFSAQNEPYRITQTAQGKTSFVEILEYEPLRGCSSMSLPQSVSLYFAQQQGLRLRQARITMDRGGCQIQAGLLQFMRGSISIETDVSGVGGFFRNALKGAVTGETAVKPRYSGSGQIFLEPTFGHLVVSKLENEEMVLADGMFYAVEAGVAIEVVDLGSLSAGLFGGQGFFQTKLKGTGWVVLARPVAEAEIVRYTLNGPHEELKLDGAFGLMRKGNIEFSVEKSTKTWLGSAVSGEGMLQTYRGTGEVWVAPTMAAYENLHAGGLQAASGTNGNDEAQTVSSNAVEGVASLFRAFTE